MPKRLTPALLLLLAAAGPLAAQTADPPALEPGVRVRLLAPDWSQDRIVATVLRQAGDSLQLRTARPLVTERWLRLDKLETLEVETGRRRAASARIGALAGAVVLGGIAALSSEYRAGGCNGRPNCFGDDGAKYLPSIGIAAALGALGGGLFGALVAPNRWRLLLP